MGASDPEGRWWLSHFLVTVAIVLFLITILLSALLGRGNYLVVALAVVSIAMMILFGFFGVVDYYRDAKALRAANAAWQPNPWVWIVGGFIFGQVFLMPIYLARRWWTVGLDWSKLPLIGRRA